MGIKETGKKKTAERVELSIIGLKRIKDTKTIKRNWLEFFLKNQNRRAL